ncbi:MAG: chromosome segregation protein SMC [Betaproteobacteria bacterium]|nr:chromosome segregation protein SMC [Betaproteobacteria bacterium]
MRLTQIKLAGFKSFVDPTSVAIPGNLVAVVGPNGCGKSNIIDAVRWVLGETRASALRGESMQDVIFNGSVQRKPVARASVELLFDNAMGRAAGQWSQYAEISVRRVLQRDGESSYFINNTHVRRRDIQDIFLGTGVGPRAYAIIEQGMISRVIEAKPEELRVFLEEAAGISKYKERRRETENRLQDTRENLARVDDIRRELDSQIKKLTRQAEVAREFNALQSELNEKQHLLWLVRKRDAVMEHEKVRRDIGAITLMLEEETARLREVESALESTRVEHYDAGDGVNAAQGELFTVNSEVARIEAELRFIAETRQRLQTQGTQLANQLTQWQRQASELREALGMWTARHGNLGEARAIAEERVRIEEERLPGLDREVRSAQELVRDARQRVVEVERARQVQEAHRSNLDKTIERLVMRDARLEQEAGELKAPDLTEVMQREAQLRAFDEQLARLTDAARSVEANLPALEVEFETASQRRIGLERDRHQLDGRLSTLRALQARVDRNEPIDDWLSRHDLKAAPRLWQRIRVHAGWEAAVESVLRERLHAIAVGSPAALSALLASPPSGRLSLIKPNQSDASRHVVSSHRSLASVISAIDATLAPLLADWCHGYFIADHVPTQEECARLAPGMALVDRAGHHYRRYSISFHAPDTADAGILARQREIEGLDRELVDLDQQLVGARAAALALEAQLSGARGHARQLRAQEAEARQARHRIELDHVRLAEAIERVRARSVQLSAERDEIAAHLEADRVERARIEDRVQLHLADGVEKRTVLEAAVLAEAEAHRALEAQRQVAQRAQREEQESAFAVRECESKIAEIERAVGGLDAQIEQSTVQERNVRAELSALKDDDLRTRLDELLAARVEKEERLADSRRRHDDLTTQLREHEEARLGCEQQLGPLRDQISDARLKEQAASLAIAQFEQQLADASADQAALVVKLDKPIRPSVLQGEINRLGQAIQALGAINMAALDELTTDQERKHFLDAQSGDLAEALDTLENAIRRIDRESRDMLKQTFDAVNANFAKMFPVLFGGGEAKLVMTGEEILDAGVQVMAQPPGKRNQSIHLLSGGEKALTATSLIFSMFQLNPAPFCLLDEVDAPLDDSNTERFCRLVKTMSAETQFLFITHNKITMELGGHLIGVTMQEQGVSRIVAVDIEEALRMREAA